MIRAKRAGALAPWERSGLPHAASTLRSFADGRITVITACRANLVILAASWHLDFSHARLSDAITTSAATALIHIAAGGCLRISVHELPLLRRIVRQHAALLPLLMMTDAAEAMHVSSSGDVRVNDIVVGNVRVQTFDTIQERSGSYVVRGIPSAGIGVLQPCRRSELFH